MPLISDAEARVLFCRECDHTGWVCEAHPGRPYRQPGRANRNDACSCGAAAGCACNPQGSVAAIAAGPAICSVWETPATQKRRRRQRVLH